MNSDFFVENASYKYAVMNLRVQGRAPKDDKTRKATYGELTEVRWSNKRKLQTEQLRKLMAMERTINFHSNEPRRMSYMYDRGVETDGDEDECDTKPRRRRKR